MQKPTHRNICEGRCWGWENLNFCYWITGGSIWTGDSLLAQNLPSTQDTQVQSLSYKDPLAKGMATPSSILAWKIPWTEETGRLQSVAKSYRGCKESDRTERLTYNVDKLKTVGGQSWVSFTSWRFYQLVSIREKSPHAFGRERGKRTILKHGACCLFQQVLPWRETYPKLYLLGYYQRLTNLGEKPCSAILSCLRKVEGRKTEKLWNSQSTGSPKDWDLITERKWKWSSSVVSNSLRPHRLYPTRFLRPWDFPGKNTGVGCH